MRFSRSFRAGLLAAFFVTATLAQKHHSNVAPAAPAPPPPPKEHSPLSYDEYEHLLNLILPIDHAVPPAIEYTMVLRFEPHVHPESQIVIRHWRDGHTETAIYRVDHGNAWRSAYGNITDGQTPDFNSMVKETVIRRNGFLLGPDQERRWHNEIFPTLERDFGKVRALDKHNGRGSGQEVGLTGTRYELWYIQADDEIHVVSWDSEVEDFPTGSFVLTKWMNLIRWYANGHMTTYAPFKDASGRAPASRPLPLPAPAKP